MNTDQLIDKLVAEGAHKPLPHPMLQALFWLTGTLVYLAALSGYNGFRADIAEKFAETLYFAEVTLLSLTAMSAALAALYLSRPDCRQMPWIKYVPFGFLVFWAAVAFTESEMLNVTNIFYTVTLCEFDCLWYIFLFSTPPGIALFLVIRAGAPVQCYWAGTMATLSVTAFGYLCMRFVEMNDNPAHLLVWHALPVMMMCIAGMIAGKYALRWR